jgi:exonuclease VII small subunit
MLQQHEIVELRTLLAEIDADEAKVEKAEKDLAFAQLCISSAEARLETARARVKELTGADRDEMDLLKRLSSYSEQYGREHQ